MEIEFEFHWQSVGLYLGDRQRLSLQFDPCFQRGNEMKRISKFLIAAYTAQVVFTDFQNY